jgi:Peptidase inhibitor family I36
VINARQISYDHGAVVVTVPIPGVETVCPEGYACLYDLTRLRGDIATIQYPEQANISIRGYLPDVESVWNRRNNGSILSNGKGSTVCYVAGQTANAVSPPVSNYPYLWLQANDNC